MKLSIPIEVDFDNMKSLLDDLGKLQTYKLFEGDEMVLVSLDDVAEVLMNHVKAKKSATTDGLISRKAVFYALECMRFASDAERRYASSMLEQIPIAQPELIEKAAYIRGFEQGRTQGMIDSQGGKK